jgi:hypothetical protein
MVIDGSAVDPKRAHAVRHSLIRTLAFIETRAAAEAVVGVAIFPNQRRGSAAGD